MKDLVIRDFELDAKEEDLSEEELFDLLADQIAYMLEFRLEFLLSLMYRLDIAESKVNYALSPHSKDPANVALAHLVFERQKQRAFTKKHYKQEKLNDLEGLDF